MFKVAFPLISNISWSTCRTLDWVLSSQSELTECFMSMYAHSDCENLSCPYHMCFYELTILWCFIWSHHTSSSNRDVEILFEISNVWLRWGQSSKYTKAHHVTMLSKHTTPGNRLYYDFTNGTVMTLWCYTCIAILIYFPGFWRTGMLSTNNMYIIMPLSRMRSKGYLPIRATCQPTNRHIYMLCV